MIDELARVVELQRIGHARCGQLDPAEDTVHCASAALYFNGTLGPDDMAEHPAPPGGAELSAFAMNVVALGKLSDRFDSHMQVLIDRALEIARGGSGRSAGAAPETEEKA